MSAPRRDPRTMPAPPYSAEDLTGAVNPLAAHYQAFRVDERLLLTGHSHQAWPDAAADGQRRAFEVAADLVDAKWGAAFDVAERVRDGWRAWLGEPGARVALGTNTHELLLRLLSALDLRRRPRIVTTDGEFHSARRQLDRLAEEGIELVKVPSRPAHGVADRLVEAVDDRTALVLVSSVQFATAHVVGGLDRVADACARVGAELCVDAYHQLGVLPASPTGLDSAWVLGGGYKYCQLGEGNGMLRLPPHADELRPALTGWYADADPLTHETGRTAYADGPDRWAWATYDPTAHFRAAAVLDAHAALGLTIDIAHAVNRRQVTRLEAAIGALDAPPAVLQLDTEVPLDQRGGFVALTSPIAAELRAELARRGVSCDHRGEVLRLGPAPYLSDTQLDDAATALGEVVRARAAGPGAAWVSFPPPGARTPPSGAPGASCA